ncbi:TRAP transporter small permease [Aquincola sp. MAHUQ-54]|uniref:TRAP transporter small permease protein n=1 Tax=Aquincola agrisoli TaxID=3119538 RepID=A0AAW9QB18_9BURK
MVLFLATMVALVFGNVVLRYVFNSGITVSEELSRWLFVWMTFLGALVALRRHGHLGTDALISRLPPAGKRVCLVVGQLLMLWVTWLLLKGSWQQAVINADVQAPVTGLSMAIVYASGIVFAASALLIIGLDLLRAITGRISDDALVMIQESEDAAELQAALDKHNNDKR